MTNVDIARVVEQFICTELAPDCGAAELPDDESLLDSGILDSLGIMTLLTFIEDRFRVRIPVDQVEPQNFESVATISTLIARVEPQA